MDKTSNSRQDKREAELREAARLNGFGSVSEMMTYIKNKAKEGEAVVNKSPGS